MHSDSTETQKMSDQYRSCRQSALVATGTSSPPDQCATPRPTACTPAPPPTRVGVERQPLEREQRVVGLHHHVGALRLVGEHTAVGYKGAGTGERRGAKV